MNTVEGLGKINKVYLKRLLPFRALFHNISQRENVVNIASSLFGMLPVPLKA